jgi:hypothetical protein
MKAAVSLIEVKGVYSRRELSKVSIAPMRACAMRYDRSSSNGVISVAPFTEPQSPASVFGLKLVQLPQAHLNLWWDLGRLVWLILGLSLLAVILLLPFILAGAFCYRCLLLGTWSSCSTWLFVFISYDKLRVELRGIRALPRRRCLAAVAIFRSCCPFRRRQIA